MRFEIGLMIALFSYSSSCGRGPAPDLLLPEATQAAIQPEQALSSAVPNEAAALASIDRKPAESAPPAPAPLRHDIHGRVVDVRTGLGMQGVAVNVQYDGKWKVSVQTDALGHYSVTPPPAASGASIVIKPPSAWRWLSPNRIYNWPLTPEQFSGQAAFDFRVAEKQAMPVHGVAVSKKTGEPLAHHRFGIKAKRGYKEPIQIVEVETDANGRFQTTEAVQGGDIEIQWAKGEAWQAVPRPVKPAEDYYVPGPWRIEFDAEPRMNLSLSGAIPAEQEQLRFHIIRMGSVRPNSTSILRHDGGAGWWVLPPTPRPDVRAGEEVLLAVADEAGFCFGSTLHTWGAELGAPIQIELQATAALELSIEMAQPSNHPEEHWWQRPSPLISLKPKHTYLSHASQWRLESRRWLPGGSYDLSVSSRIHPIKHESITLENGKSSKHMTKLELAKNSRTVRGSVAMESGAPLQSMSLTVSLLHDPGSSWRVSWERSSMCGTGIDHFLQVEKKERDEIGHFELEHVPHGELSAALGAWNLPASLTITETADGEALIKIILLDKPGGPGMGFHIAGDAQWDDRYCVHTLVHDAGSELSNRPRNHDTISNEMPSKRRLDWAVTSKGYQTVYGNQTSFEPEAPGRFFASVQLIKGWRQRVRVVDQNGVSIVGAEVKADGLPRGFTNAEGIYELTGERAALHIEASHPSFGPATHFPDVNAFRPWHEIVLVRP